MNLILISEDDLAGPNCAEIKGRRLKHILHVHRAVKGDELAVGLLNGPLGRGRITAISADSLTIELHLGMQPPPALPATLLLALPRPKMLRRIITSAASMGVKQIYLINSYRVEKGFWSSPFLEKESIDEYLMLGLEQAKDTMMPAVHMRPLFKPFVEDELNGIIGEGLALVAHPEAAKDCPRGVDSPATIAIGPEGGFIRYEIDKLCAAGFEAVTLGPRPLRVETVVPALLSRLF